ISDQSDFASPPEYLRDANRDENEAQKAPRLGICGWIVPQTIGSALGRLVGRRRHREDMDPEISNQLDFSEPPTPASTSTSSSGHGQRRLRWGSRSPGGTIP